MAKINGNYEALYILNPALDEESIAALVAKFKAVVEAGDSAAQVESYGEIYDIPLSRNTQTGNSANSGEPGIPGKKKPSAPSSRS